MNRSVVLAALWLIACGDNEAPGSPDAAVPEDAAGGPIDVTVRVRAQVGAAPFACCQTYASMGQEATPITPRDFRLYAHDVELIRDDGVHVPLTLVQDGTWQYQSTVLLDFEDFTGGCADGTPETNTSIRGSVPS